jgi:pimeloyl-ACP methyl ester carboxylesterase
MTKTLWQTFLGSEVRIVRGAKFQTRIVEAGRGNPETLIMTHPGGGHLETFAHNIVPLGESIHAVGLEMLWHGFSGTPAIQGDRTDMEGQQVLDVLDALGVEKAWVHGAASGGVVPTWIALNHPDRLKGIIYQATSGGVRVDTGLPSIPPVVGGMSLSDQMFMMLKNPTREAVRDRLLHTVHPSHADMITEELIETRLAIYRRPSTNEAMTRYYSKPTKFAVTEDEISQLKMPVLILASDQSEQSVAGSQRMASLIQGAQFRVLKTTGLWGHWEAPDEFNEAILTFIRGGKVSD